MIPSLWIDYKSSTIKQYFKQQRALRTETTINDTRDFRIGRKIKNLPALRELAFSANRRLLDVQKLDHDPTLGQDQFDGLTKPAVIDGQRVSGLKFGDPVVLAVLPVFIPKLPLSYALACFTVSVVAVSFVYTWLRLRSGSVFPAALLHATSNAFMGAFEAVTRHTELTS